VPVDWLPHSAKNFARRAAWRRHISKGHERQEAAFPSLDKLYCRMRVSCFEFVEGPVGAAHLHTVRARLHTSLQPCSNLAFTSLFLFKYFEKREIIFVGIYVPTQKAIQLIRFICYTPKDADGSSCRPSGYPEDWDRWNIQELELKYFRSTSRLVGLGTRGSVVVKALCYKPEDLGFDTR
jgi:hypothetical protein